jgi:hypothetical protein
VKAEQTTRTPRKIEASSSSCATEVVQECRSPVQLAAEVARVLAAMSYEERMRAYRSGALSAHELAIAAGWLGEEMPMLNGEYEWIAIDLE